MAKFLIKRMRYSGARGERFKLATAELAALVDALVFLCSLGYLTSQLRIEVIFSEWFSDD